MENLTEYKFVISCKIKGMDYAISFSESATCDNQDLLDQVRAALNVIEKKVEDHFSA